MAPLMFILGLMLTIAGCELSEGGLDCKVAVDYGPIGLGIATNQRNPPAPPPPPPSPPKETATVTRIRVHGRLQEAKKLVKRVLPEYPKSACEEGVAGTVHLLVTIAKNGSIREAKVVEGHPRLSRAAELAIKQWRYRSTLVNGNPVDVITSIYVRFLISPRHPGR